MRSTEGAAAEGDVPSSEGGIESSLWMKPGNVPHINRTSKNINTIKSNRCPGKETTRKCTIAHPKLKIIFSHFVQFA